MITAVQRLACDGADLLGQFGSEHGRAAFRAFVVVARGNGAQHWNGRKRTRRGTATPISRPVYMVLRSFNINPVIDARPR